MKTNYSIELETDENNKPLWCSVNCVYRYYCEGLTTEQAISSAILSYEKLDTVKDGVYNKAVFWPDRLVEMINKQLMYRYRVSATKHCLHKCEILHLPKNCYKAMMYGEVIEAEIRNGSVVKIVTRLPNRYNMTEDICAAILLHDEGFYDAKVKTVWTNCAEDNHSTINVSNYIKKLKS